MKIKKLINCARCNGNHKDLNFTKLKYPIEGYNGLVKEIIFTHFCSCPTNNQPIMLRICKN